MSNKTKELLMTIAFYAVFGGVSAGVKIAFEKWQLRNVQKSITRPLSNSIVQKGEEE